MIRVSGFWWFVSFLTAVPLVAQQGSSGATWVDRWKNYTDMKVIRSVAVSHDSIWAATSGGLFLYNASTRQITKFTNSEGLSSNDLSAITIDGAGHVWAGASDGSLDMYNIASKQWNQFGGIKESEKIQKGVRSFFVQNDSLFIGTDFGVSVFLISRSEFRDTYASFGFPSQAKVNDILVYKNTIWIATDFGVAAASLSATNLSSPTSWMVYGTSEGLPSRYATSVTVFRDTILAGTTYGAAAFANNAFQALSQFNAKSVVDIVPRTNDVLVAWNTDAGFSYASLSSISAPLTAVITNTEGQASVLAVQSSPPAVWVGTTFKGVAKWNNTAWEYVMPNGPNSNLFSSVVVDEQGRVWAASGISDRGRGFYRFDPSLSEGAQWKNFSVSDYPSMRRNDYYKVSLGLEGSVWVSSWGYGVIQVANDSIQRHLDDLTVPSFSLTIDDANRFVVIGGVAADAKGNTWFNNRTAINTRPLVKVASDNSAQYFSSPSQGFATNLVVDRNNTKWIANSEPFNKPTGIGLLYFNEDTLVAGTKFTDGWGALTQSDGLPSSGVADIILSLAVDLEGQVCVGTDGGFMIITDPLHPKAASGRTVSFPLRLQSIQAIAVDALNNKWLGTKDGVIVVNPDGSQVLKQYNVLSTNGQLVDNDIRSIAIDQKKGIVYIGTEKGLSSLEIQPVRVQRNYTSLDFGPNPYIIPNAQLLTIRNLVAETSIKILSVHGTLVSEFKAQGGGRAFWDGRDMTGQLVPSGVYFVVAFTENGSQLTTGKIAVIRR